MIWSIPCLHDIIDRFMGQRGVYFWGIVGKKYKGVTAVLNFQSGTEAENWGINAKSINESCQRKNILMINYPIR